MKTVKTVIKQLITGALCTFTTLQAGPVCVPDAIKGVKITPDTLAQLSPQVPRQLQKQLDSWLNEDQTRMLLDRLTEFSALENWQEDRNGALALMADLGYENLSDNNYVAYIPDLDFIFKIDGQGNRLVSMLATKGIVLDPAQQTDENIRAYVSANLPEALPTYQTASRMAYYLLLKDRMRKKGYRHVHVPESYMVHVPGKPEGVADGNVLIVQRKIPHTEKLMKGSNAASDLSKGVLKELYDAVVSLGLWNIDNNILLHKNGSVYLTCSIDLVGLAQPRNSSAKDFFHKSKERFDENVYVGLQHLLDLFKDDEVKTAWIQKHIRKDERLEHSTYYEELMKLAQ